MQIYKLLLLSLILSAFCSLPTLGQEKSTFLESELIKIESELVHCKMKNGYDLNRVLLHIENKSQDTLSISWNLNLSFDGSCVTCDHESDEYKMSIEILPESSVSGSCEQHTGKVLQFFHSFEDENCDIETELTDFELDELSVRKL